MQISDPASPATSDTRHQRLFPAGHLLPFFLVTSLFFLWGVPNNLNDVLIRQFMKVICHYPLPGRRGSSRARDDTVSRNSLR